MLSCTFHCWDWSVDSRSDGTVIQSQPCSIMPQLQQNNCWNESGRFRRVYSRISVSLLQCWSLAFKQTPAQNTVNSGCEHWSEVTTSEKLTDAEPAESRKCVCCVIANKRLYIYAHTVCCASKQCTVLWEKLKMCILATVVTVIVRVARRRQWEKQNTNYWRNFFYFPWACLIVFEASVGTNTQTNLYYFTHSLWLVIFL